MPLFSKVFRSKDATKKTTTPATNGASPGKPQWVDSWLRTRVDPDEVAELLHGCTQELKARALDVPFLLLPFRPSSDPSAARTFVRNYFLPLEGRQKLVGKALMAELKMTEVMVLISVVKWCWARLPGGVVSWETYKMFKIGEKDAKYARDAFHHFIPISVESNARVRIINDFFDLLASLAAHGKSNGLGGHKLSRYAGWWAFEHYDAGKGFEAGYKSWDSAADATCHLFFAFLRAQSPEVGKTNGILDLPRSLQQLVAATSYPPTSGLLSNNTTKVVMIVDVVSPTPYALLRRAKNFEYRADDQALQQFAENDDPVDALTDECRRVLRAISTTNQSNVSDAKTSTSLVDPSWSRFEDIGFSTALDDIGEDDSSIFGPSKIIGSSLNTTSQSTRQPTLDLNRPTTPSWGDFLATGFVDENNKTVAPILLPPDKILPPIMPQARGQSSQSHRRDLDTGSTLEPGELASITKIPVDDAFWWVWITSLAGEEPTSRKAVFGRCAYIETNISHGQWMIMEEQVKGAAPEPVKGAYIAEKKGFLGFTTKKGRLTRRRSGLKKSTLTPEPMPARDVEPASRSTVTADQQARIQKAAQELSNKKRIDDNALTAKRGRRDENDPNKTNSVYTLGGLTKDEASPALQWAKQYDKNTIRSQYLGNNLTGKGSTDYLLNGSDHKKSTTTLADAATEKDLPTVPTEKTGQNSLTSRPITDVPPPAPAKESSPAPEQSAIPISSAPIVIAQKAATPADSTASSTAKDTETTATPILVQSKPSSPANSRTLNPPSPEQQMKTSSSSNQKPNGIKRLFGTMRKNKDEESDAPAQNEAVAAARRALEGKVNSEPNSAAGQDRAKQFQAGQSVKSRVAALTQSPQQPKSQANVPVAVQTPVTPVEVTTATPVTIAAPVETALPEEPAAPTKSISPALPPKPEAGSSEPTPPRTRRDEEFDQLSRVDTNEREQADEEFSRFDQGRQEEPATYVPNDSPIKEDFEESSNQAKHQSVYSAVTMQTEETDDEDDNNEADQEKKGMNANDRWAQIRKNAADRAARSSEDHGNRSRTETRTDDGDTSGEETIESRVARIKARVAELTGNMDQVRR